LRDEVLKNETTIVVLDIEIFWSRFLGCGYGYYGE